MHVELPKLSLEEKWETAASNLIYFVICGITYAKAQGGSVEEFGTWAGEVAAPYWEPDRAKGPCGLVEGISYNKQQFRNFQMEILDESAHEIRARMRGFGEDIVADPSRWRGEVSVNEYIEFFGKKWIAIAEYLGLEYSQSVEGAWVVFSVAEKTSA